MDSKTETLMECLSATGLRELPPKIDANDKRTWLRGICEVLKIGGRREYCLCENDGKGKCVVKRDFGICASIVQVCNIHPYEFADKTIVPRFVSDADIVKYLSKSSRYNRAEIEALIQSGDRDEINRRVNQVSLDLQKEKEKEKSRVRELKELAEANPKTTKTNGRKRKNDNKA